MAAPRHFFFVNYNGKRGENPFDQFSTVPTLAESARETSRQTNYTSGPQAGQPGDRFINPATGTPFANNTITADQSGCSGIASVYPSAESDPRARELSKFSFRYFGEQQQRRSECAHQSHTWRCSGRRASWRGPRRLSAIILTFGLHYHGVEIPPSRIRFPSVGGNTSVRSFDVPVGYVRSFGKLTNSLRFDFNRSRTHTQNLYAFNSDIAGTLGINGRLDQSV